LSPESQRLRFFGVHPHLAAAEVQRFTRVDHQAREAFVVIRGGEILGVGRYDRLPSGTDAEVAFVTRDTCWGLGIATLLFWQLAAAAQAAGIRTFVAETLPENRRMQRVFDGTGLVAERTYAGGVVEISMVLPETGADPDPQR
jgi:RimJ/RimL family protein N-acetyltransferase